MLDRTADCMSNGAYVLGTYRADWCGFDLAGLEAVLKINGTVVAQKIGGHATKDPLLPGHCPGQRAASQQWRAGGAVHHHRGPMLTCIMLSRAISCPSASRILVMPKVKLAE